MLFEDRSLAPYEGEEPYIFLSYSHLNATAAAEVIRYLKAAGFRIWYDEGVIPATQWDENIARAIENCGYLIALISEAYLSSSNCLDELNYARDRNIPMLLIYLEDVSLPSGLAMRLGRLLAIHRYRYDNPAAFYAKVVRSRGIGVCGDGRFEAEEAAEAEKYANPDAFWLDEESEEAVAERPSVFRPVFLILLALLVGFAAFLLLRGWASERVHGIYGSGENTVTETLPAPDPIPYKEPETDAEIEIEVTPTPEPSETPEPTPEVTPTPTPTPESTPTPTPTLTPSPDDTVTVVVQGPSVEVTPDPSEPEPQTEPDSQPEPEPQPSPPEEPAAAEETPAETPATEEVPEATPTPTPETSPET